MVGEIILIAGPLGSGKTTHMDSMWRDGWTDLTISRRTPITRQSGISLDS